MSIGASLRHQFSRYSPEQNNKRLALAAGIALTGLAAYALGLYVLIHSVELHAGGWSHHTLAVVIVLSLLYAAYALFFCVLLLFEDLVRWIFRIGADT